MSQPAADAPDRVRDKWNETMRKRLATRDRQFCWHHPVVQRFMREHYLGGHTVSGYLKDYLGGRPIRNALEVGGGLGDQAIAFYHQLGVERFDVLDISDVAVAAGNDRAREQGLNVHYAVSDLNHDDLPDRDYDLIIASGALHHIENLEHLFAQIDDRLTPQGVFFANDYMGPSQMQWREDQLRLMNAVVSILPDELNRVAHRGDQVVREVRPIPLEIFARVDPSEGVRAAEIFDVMRDHLKIERIVPFGQTLAYEMLRGRVHNFDDDDPKDNAILSLICLLEKELMDAGVIGSDFNLVIARPRKAA